LTLPTTSLLPLHAADIKSGGDDLYRYLKELTATLQRQYVDVADAVNGNIRGSVEQGSSRYLPTVSGAGTAGDGTYAADGVDQIGWVLRQGILVDVWFDVRWTAHTGTGGLQLDLPYQVSTSSNNPFIGVVSAENITFSGYLTGSASPGSRAFLIEDNRTGTTSAAIAVPNADTTIRGHVRYMGVSIERS